VENFVTRSKYVSETISIIVDFADVLPAGQAIQGTPTVSIALDTGDDPTPASILYLGVSITNGTIVEQRFRLGVPGVIYEITWQIASTSNEVFEKTTYLAILPNIGSVAPNHQYLFLTSELYPLQTQDAIVSILQPQNGLFAIGQTWNTEILQVSFSPQNGTLIPAQLFYVEPPEGIQISLLLQNGTFVVGQLFYTTQPEQIKISFAPLDGTLTPGQVFYTSPAETFQVGFSPQNGTFTT
jgi:hypothetical protein